MDTAVETDFVPVADADALRGWLPCPGRTGRFLHDATCPTGRRALWEAAEAAKTVVDLVARRLPARYGFAVGDVQVLAPMRSFTAR